MEATNEAASNDNSGTPAGPSAAAAGGASLEAANASGARATQAAPAASDAAPSSVADAGQAAVKSEAVAGATVPGPASSAAPGPGGVNSPVPVPVPARSPPDSVSVASRSVTRKGPGMGRKYCRYCDSVIAARCRLCPYVTHARWPCGHDLHCVMWPCSRHPTRSPCHGDRQCGKDIPRKRVGPKSHYNSSGSRPGPGKKFCNHCEAIVPAAVVACM